MSARPFRAVRRTVLLALATLVILPGIAFAAVSDRPERTASFNGVVHTLGYRDHTVYVGGDFTTARDASGTVRRNHVAAIDAVTGQLRAWNPRADGEVTALAVNGEQVFLGGQFARVGGVPRQRLAKVSAVGVGTVAPDFDHRASATVWAMAVRGGRLFVGGAFAHVDGIARAHLAAFDVESGQLVDGWQPRASAIVRTLRGAPGRIYVGGDFDALSGSRAAGNLAAVRPDTGALVNAFDPKISYPVYDVAVTARRVYAAADGPGGRLRAFGLDGAGRWNITTDGGVQAVAVLNGNVYLGGHFDRVCRTRRTGPGGICRDGSADRRKLAAVGPRGRLLGWRPQANSAPGVWALDANAALDKVAAGGAFTAFRGGSVRQPHFAQFG